MRFYIGFAQLAIVGGPLRLPKQPPPSSRGLDVVVLWTTDVEGELYAILVIQQIYNTFNLLTKVRNRYEEHLNGIACIVISTHS